MTEKTKAATTNSMNDTGVSLQILEDIKRIKSEYREQLCARMNLTTVDTVDQFLGKHQLPYFTQHEIGDFNSLKNSK